MMKKRDKNYLINVLLLLLLIMVITSIYQKMDITSFNMAFSWYFILLIFTIVGFPISYLIFNKFYDRGYIFAKIIGFLIPGYLTWCMASFHIVKFTYTSCLIFVIIVGLISYLYLIISKILKKDIKDFTYDMKSKWMTFYRLEICFLIVFLLVAYIKGFNPDANSTEKYMDYGFMAVMNNTDYFPSVDMWLAGANINYYYFGHYLLTFIAKTAQIDISYGYNLSVVTLFTITLFEAFTIGFNLVKRTSSNKYLPYFGGIISSLGVNIAGNFHYVVFNIIYPALYTVFHMPYNNYDFWSSTRYIGYNPDRVDKVIHEFPNFSFVIGDLHSHVIDIFLVLLFIGLLLAYLMNDKDKSYRLEASSVGVISLSSIMMGLVLGAMKMTNFWDYPIYLVVIFLFLLFYYLAKYETFKEALLMLVYQLIFIFCLSQVFTLPFTMTFIKIASKIAISPYHTIFYQLLVLWGIPIFMVLYYFLFTIANSIPIKIDKYLIKNYVQSLRPGDYFILIIGFSAIGLILSTEVLYVVDIFFDSAPRFNTVFKFTYQSFIMFGVCYGYILPILYNSSRKTNRSVAKVLIVLFLLTCCYAYTSTEQWFGDITNKKNYKTLDATAFLKNNTLDYDDVLAIDNSVVIEYIKEHVKKDAVIIEASGDSYSSDNQISVFTGRSTVLGWTGHEWLWRSENSNFDYPQLLVDRDNDIHKFYSSGNIDELIDIINTYKIDYIVIGYTERKKYGDSDLRLYNEDILLSLGEVVVETNQIGANWPTYLIKVSY